jgi:hypothetical protein
MIINSINQTGKQLFDFLFGSLNFDIHTVARMRGIVAMNNHACSKYTPRHSEVL